MNKSEIQFYAKVKELLAKPEADRDIETGAKLMLQGTRRRSMYNSIMRRPQNLASKLWYELSKVDKHGDELLAKDNRLKEEKKIIKSATHAVTVEGPKRHAENKSGMRADHDKLPTQVQDYYTGAGELYKDLKAKHAQVMLAVNSRDVDARKELVDELAHLDDTRRDLLKKYDEYVDPSQAEIPSEPGGEPGKEPADTPPAEQELTKEDKNAVNSARKYITTNIQKIDAAHEKDAEYVVPDEMKEKLLERYNTLAGFGKATDEQRERLVALGVLTDDTDE